VLEHHIQKTIVYALALTPSARFGELKPDGIENKLFDYHLKKVIASGLVEKTESGEYALTSLGRRVGKDALKKNDQLIDRAYSVLFMAIRRADDGAWLLCKRKAHPLFGQIGFIHAQPELHEASATVAKRVVQEKTGLQADFTVRGSGYLRMYEQDSLESFTHFTLFEAVNMTGELQQLDELADYYWQVDPDFNATDILPSFTVLAQRLQQLGLFFLEEEFRS